MSDSIFYSSFSYSYGSCSLLPHLWLRLSFNSCSKPPPCIVAPFGLNCFLFICLTELAAANASFILAITKLLGLTDLLEKLLMLLSLSPIIKSSLGYPLVSRSRSKSSTLRFIMISMLDLMYSITWKQSVFFRSFFFSFSKFPSLISSS